MSSTTETETLEPHLLPTCEAPQSTAVPVRRSCRYDTLDLWRGVACVAVVIYHATMQVAPSVTPGETLGSRLAYVLLQVSGILWVGVPMFFVISGYCIFATLEKSVARGDTIGRYFVRRFRRIYPPYWIALALCAVLIVAAEIAHSGLFTRGYFTIIEPTLLSGSQWLGNLTLTESWRAHVFGDETAFILPHVWTLCYEEQFYAVAGLILLLAPHRMYLASLAVSLLVVGTMVLGKRLGLDLEGTFLDGRWLLFAAGILVYYTVNHASRKAKNAIAMGLATALVLMLVSGSVPWAIHLNRSVERFTAVAFALTLVVLHPYDAQMKASQLLTPLFLCGTMCYSLYLTHALVTKSIGHGIYRAGVSGPWETLLIAVPLSLAISLPVGWYFYLTVERRFLNR